jgi:ankyrin repeat protein
MLPDQNTDGHSALMFAYNGRSQVLSLRAKYLAVVQPDQTAVASDSNLDVIDAALKAHSDIIDRLLKKGASPTLADKEGRVAKDFDHKPSSEKTPAAAVKAGTGEL